MARTPETVNIGLHELMILLNYRFAAVNSPDIGELGNQNHDDLVDCLNAQAKLEIKPAQLADLIHHMKEVIFERVEPVSMKFTLKNHNKMMRRLKKQIPNLFKELPTGEIVMVELEEKAFE